MKLITFGASYTQNSINRQWAHFIGQQLALHIPRVEQVDSLDLNAYDLPLYTIEREAEIGVPEAAHRFVSDLATADLVVVSLAEYNGSYTAGFKNLFDWASRVELKFFGGKPVVVTSTAPGPRGGLTVLQTAADRFPRHGAEVFVGPALPQFNHHFDRTANKLVSDEWQNQLNEALSPLVQKYTSANFG
jgi:NAD(P)H-dependent FMN reductase